MRKVDNLLSAEFAVWYTCLFYFDTSMINFVENKIASYEWVRLRAIIIHKLILNQRVILSCSFSSHLLIIRTKHVSLPFVHMKVFTSFVRFFKRIFQLEQYFVQVNEVWVVSWKKERSIEKESIS